MTTYYTRTTICGVCSTSFEYSDISSTNSFGSPDLDTRPPEMQRSTINTWVQRCPGCGACAFDLSRLDNSAKSIIESPKYKEQLNNKEYSDLANYFLCKSIIEENLGQHVNATWSLIHGAWILDDNSSLELAKLVRKRAAENLLKLESKDEFIAVNKAANTALLIDLLRRSHQPDRASEIIKERRSEIEEDLIVKVIDFQEILISHQKTECFKVSDAIDYSEGNWNDPRNPFRANSSKWWQFWKS